METEERVRIQTRAEGNYVVLRVGHDLQSVGAYLRPHEAEELAKMLLETVKETK